MPLFQYARIHTHGTGADNPVCTLHTHGTGSTIPVYILDEPATGRARLTAHVGSFMGNYYAGAARCLYVYSDGASACVHAGEYYKRVRNRVT